MMEKDQLADTLPERDVTTLIDVSESWLRHWALQLRIGLGGFGLVVRPTVYAYDATEISALISAKALADVGVKMNKDLLVALHRASTDGAGFEVPLNDLVVAKIDTAISNERARRALHTIPRQMRQW